MSNLENDPNPYSELQLDAEQEDGEELNLPVSQREVLTRPGEPEVRSLYEKQKRGRLVLQPDFQRHIEQYWQGGKTIPENARLTHRYCNSARPRND